MPTTPTYGLRWPLSSDTPDVPRDLQNLAQDTETAILAATTGHARGTLPSQSIPNATSTKTAISIASIGTITQAGGTFTLVTPGYYAVSLHGEWAASVGTFGFLEIRGPEPATGQGATRRSRTNVAGSNETIASVSQVAYSDGTGQVEFYVNQNSGSSINVSGAFTISYLGA